jgi:small-conductance mechanosensitive channel
MKLIRRLKGGKPPTESEEEKTGTAIAKQKLKEHGEKKKGAAATALDNLLIGRMEGRLDDIKSLRQHTQDLIESYEIDLQHQKEQIAKLKKQLVETQAQTSRDALQAEYLRRMFSETLMQQKSISVQIFSRRREVFHELMSADQLSKHQLKKRAKKAARIYEPYSFHEKHKEPDMWSVSTALPPCSA